jgi:hypothetical protein
MQNPIWHSHVKKTISSWIRHVLIQVIVTAEGREFESMKKQTLFCSKLNEYNAQESLRSPCGVLDQSWWDCMGTPTKVPCL